MRAIILEAGFGQQLRQLTNDKPKAMVEIEAVLYYNAKSIFLDMQRFLQS